MELTELLAFAVKNGASDIHLTAGLPPMIRIDGDIKRVKVDALDEAFVREMVTDVMTDEQKAEFEEHWECDFAFEIPNLSRFRVNAYNQKRGVGAAFRTVPTKILTLEDLGAPQVLRTMANNVRGLVVVTGPTGSGKSTTMAGMINYVNENHHGHILTIEDPVEFVHESKNCLINHREVGLHTHGFAKALKRRCGRILTLFWWEKCVMKKPSVWHLLQQKLVTWCLELCTRLPLPRPSIGSSMFFQRVNKVWCGRCCPSPCRVWSRNDY